MNKKWMIPALVAGLVMTSCGGGETTEGGTTDSTATTTTETPEVAGPVAKDYSYFSTKLDAFTLDGITLTKDLVNDNADNEDLRRSWTTDPATAGCDKIQINTYSLSRTGNNRERMEHKSLQEFETVTLEDLSEGKTATEFNEYIVSDSLAFYYCTLTGCEESFGKKDFNQIYFTHFTGNVGVTGWISVYDKTMDMTKAKDVAIKTMDYLAKP